MSADGHLLIDGSNVMHAWPELKALLRRDRNAARSRLSLAAAVLHDVEGLRVTIVFDGRSAESSVEQPFGRDGFVHIHTPAGVTADDVIVQLVRRAKRPQDCLVATDDRGERQAVEALGAATISTDDLAARIERAGTRQRARLDASRRETDRRWKSPRP